MLFRGKLSGKDEAWVKTAGSRLERMVGNELTSPEKQGW
jgi:hypothetical protein